MAAKKVSPKDLKSQITVDLAKKKAEAPLKAAPKAKVEYDSFKTPAGKDVLLKGRLLDQKGRELRKRQIEMNKQDPGVGSLVINKVARMKPQYDAYLEADRTYNRQQSAAKSGFAQHLAAPKKKKGK